MFKLLILPDLCTIRNLMSLTRFHMVALFNYCVTTKHISWANLHPCVPCESTSLLSWEWAIMLKREGSVWPKGWALLGLTQKKNKSNQPNFLKRSFNLIVVIQYFTILLCHFNGYSFGDLTISSWLGSCSYITLTCSVLWAGWVQHHHRGLGHLGSTAVLRGEQWERLRRGRVCCGVPWLSVHD